MKILIAEDDLTSRRILEAILAKWNYEVIATSDGLEAWQALQTENAPPIAIIDWMMPGMDGVDFCRKIRQTQTLTPTYIILLTSKAQQEDVVAGLEAGANDYIRKPFEREELRARIRVGERVVELQTALADRVKMLEEAIVKIKTLQGLLPICSYCKKIRNDQDYWQQIETYVAEHTQAEFTHGICPDCLEKHIKGQIETLQKMKEGKNGKIP
jgi:sigma-B regulation protein RsbU (phosphoserine phosphatase)